MYRMMNKLNHIESRIDAILLERKKDKQTIEKLQNENLVFRKFIRNISENYDCDRDAHKYGTGCRCCEARNLL